MPTTIKQAVSYYLESMKETYSENSVRCYANGLQVFTAMLNQQYQASPTKKSKNAGKASGQRKLPLDRDY